MKTYSTAVNALLTGGRINVRLLVRVDLATGAQGIWNDTYSVVVGGVTYSPAAIELGSITSRKGLSSQQVDVTVSSLSSAVATIMSGIAWHQRPVLISRAFLNDAGAVLETDPIFSGFLDAAPIEDADGETLRMSLIVESNNRELSRSAGRVRSDADQRLVSATDGFFKHTTATAVDSNIYWGRQGPSNPGKA